MSNDHKARAAYGPLLGLSAIFALAALLSLLPWADASWGNVLGYKSLCSFSPISTAICALLAAATCTLRSRLFGPRRGERRSWIPPLAVGLALALTIGLATPAYAAAKADATSGASLSAAR
jgi:hypothetical protein